MIGRHVTLFVWALLGAAAVVCQLAALISRGRRLPGVGSVVRMVTTRRWGRWVLVLAWMWLGWHAFAR
ncbi:MAG: DUF6186 family protein [Acidimicrobiales bacterium]